MKMGRRTGGTSQEVTSGTKTPKKTNENSEEFESTTQQNEVVRQVTPEIHLKVRQSLVAQVLYDTEYRCSASSDFPLSET